MEASLGQLHLLAEEPARAYPRLLSAYRSFDQAIFLKLDLADAAIQIAAANDTGGDGYLAEAERLLAEVFDLPEAELQAADPYFGRRAVKANLLALRSLRSRAAAEQADDAILAAGYSKTADAQEADAISLYEFFRRQRKAPRARDRYGRFLTARGRLWEAVQVYREITEIRPDVLMYRARLVEAADRWWGSLNVVERFRAVWQTSEQNAHQVDSLVGLLRAYVRSVRYVAGEMAQPPKKPAAHRASFVMPHEGMRSPPAKWASQGGAMENGRFEEVPDFATVGAAVFSPILKRLTLDELANRMEVDNMNAWKWIIRYPAPLKRADLAIRLSPWPSVASRTVKLLMTLLPTVGASVRAYGEVVNGGFEGGLPNANCSGGYLPTSAGYWDGDQSAAVAAMEGIVPFEGAKMVRFIGSIPCGASGTYTGSELWQLVDLASNADVISTGLAYLDASAWVNRIAGDSQTDTSFSLHAYAHSGPMSSFPSTWPGEYVAIATDLLITDDDTATWESLNVRLCLPVGTTYVAVYFAASENVQNDAAAPEFDGHFGDAVVCQFSLGTDVNANGVADECECLGDFDGSLQVDLVDLETLVAHWASTTATPEQGDLDADEDVDLADYAVFQVDFGCGFPD